MHKWQCSTFWLVRDASQSRDFTDEAQQLLRIGWGLKLMAGSCLTLRDIPMSDMFRYELMEALDRQGLSFKHCNKTKEVKDLLTAYLGDQALVSQGRAQA